MSKQCPICFEAYETDPSSLTDLTPRKLPCGHLGCTRCLGDVLCDGSLVCQECMAPFQFASVTDIPVFTGPTGGEGEEQDGVGSDCDSLCSDASDYASDQSYASVSEDDCDDPDRWNTPSPTGRQHRATSSNNKLAAFMKAVPAAGTSRIKRMGSEAEKVKDPCESKSCTIPGCPNKRGFRGYCTAHYNMITADSATRATKKLERAKLSRLTFRQDRLKEKAEG